MVRGESYSDKKKPFPLSLKGKLVPPLHEFFCSSLISLRTGIRGFPGYQREREKNKPLFLSLKILAEEEFPRIPSSGFSEASTPVISPEITPLPSPRSVSDEFLPKTVSVMVAAADAASTSNFLPPPANNTIEEGLAQLRRRLEEKEAEVANWTARMVGVNNQAQQVAGQAQQVVGQTQQPMGAPL